jgi:hypothetical protein
LPKSKGMEAPTRPAGAPAARRWYEGGHDDRGHHAGALGDTIMRRDQDCAHHRAIIDRMQPIDVFRRVPRAGKV